MSSYQSPNPEEPEKGAGTDAEGVQDERDSSSFVGGAYDYFWNDLSLPEKIGIGFPSILASATLTGIMTAHFFPEYSETAEDFVEDPVGSSIDVGEYLAGQSASLVEDAVEFFLGNADGLAYLEEEQLYGLDPQTVEALADPQAVEAVAEATVYTQDIITSLG